MDLDQLAAEIRSALTHLNDPSYLENHPLARRIASASSDTMAGRGPALKRVLLLSIEALDPGASVPASSPEARPYQILRRYYISKRSMVQIAMQLAISESYAYRELRRAILSVAHIVAEYLNQDDGRTASGQPSPVTQVRAEVERLALGAYRQVELIVLLETILDSLQGLAAAHHIEVKLLNEARWTSLVANRTMLRQAVLNLLSHVLSVHEGPGAVIVRVTNAERKIQMETCFRSQRACAPVAPSAPYGIAVQILATMGIPWQLESDAEGSVCFRMQIKPAEEQVVLIVDDNPGMISLLGRYLRQRGMRIYGATSGPEALRLLERAPDVILLDIMMPDQDGWEIMQALREHPAGRQAKIVVCSIIDDPALSATMGADGFLHKPVDAADLYRVLDAALSA